MVNHKNLRRARPHPKPAGRKSAAERREEPRRSSRGPLCPKGTGPRGCRGQSPRQRRASAPRASSTRSRASGEESRPLRRPRPAASAAGPWPKRGRLSPSDAQRSEGQRSGAAAPRVRGEDRAKGGSVAAAHGGWRGQGGARKVGLWGESGAGGKQGRAKGEAQAEGKRPRARGEGRAQRGQARARGEAIAPNTAL